MGRQNSGLQVGLRAMLTQAKTTVPQVDVILASTFSLSFPVRIHMHIHIHIHIHIHVFNTRIIHVNMSYMLIFVNLLFRFACTLLETV